MTTDIELASRARETRRRLGADSRSPIDIFSLVQQIPRLTIALSPLGQNISGSCARFSAEAGTAYDRPSLMADDENLAGALIAINSSMSLGRQRFTLSHELFHLFYETGRTLIVCPQRSRGDAVERDADRFASFLLMPYESLDDRVRCLRRGSTRALTIDDVLDIEQFFGMSHAATLVRLQEYSYISAAEAEALEGGIRREAQKRGYPLDLYQPRAKEDASITYGYYVTLANELHDDGRISDAKWHEYLLDASRSDIIYHTVDIPDES